MGRSLVQHEENYVLPDGSLSSSRSDAVVVGGDQIGAFAARYSSRIPAAWFVGVATAESGRASNEADTEHYDDGTTYESHGLYQTSDEEDGSSGVAGDWSDPEVATRRFAILSEARLDRILQAAGVSQVSDDALRFLAWAHNGGIGRALGYIGDNGLNWSAIVADPSSIFNGDRVVNYVDNIMSASAGASSSILGLGLLLAAAIAAAVWS